MNIKIICTIIIATTFLSISIKAQNQANRDENVVVQMNYCINSLTNIIHNKSISVLEHESDQLVNNLTMEQIIGLPEIKDFRIDLMDAVSKFEITEEERLLMRRIQSIKRDNMKWAAISNALNPTMLISGTNTGPQLAFQALLTVARTAVEYKTMQGEQNIEELQAMWELRKEDMQTINELRKSAQGIVFELFNKYHLKEGDRLTESTANRFNEYISETNPGRRARILEDNFSTYKRIPEYYYHLGMAYLDQDDYSKAKVNFLKYLELYKKTPILRYDERSGCIALAMLTYEKTLSSTEKVELINIAISNLPNNSAALLQCVMVYLYELNQIEDGFKLLRSGIDNLHASDRGLLYMAAANLLPFIKDYPSIYSAINEVFNKSNDISYDSYTTYLMYSNDNAWPELTKLNRFDDCYYRLWYSLWIAKDYSRNFHLILPNNIEFGNDILVYSEKYTKDKLDIRQVRAEYKYAITEEDINDVDCFKSNKNLKYLYVETIEPGLYKLKSNIDKEKIKDESWPRQSEFVLSADDIEDILDFCEDYQNTTDEQVYHFKDVKNERDTVDCDSTYEITFIGDTLVYKPHCSSTQNGYYVRLVLNNGLQVVYKYDEEENMLMPYYYYNGKELVFGNEDMKLEYSRKNDAVTEEQNDAEDETPAWYDRLWTSVSEWFISDDEDADTEEESSSASEEEPSWFKRVWNSITSWFSSNDVNEDTNNESLVTPEKEDLAWYIRVWKTIVGLFSTASAE